MEEKELAALIRDIPDFPKPGIVFKDITPLLKNRAAFRAVIQSLARAYRAVPLDGILGIESRGFIVGAPLAYEMGVPYIPARKPGKLPYRTVRVEYALEYGKDALEMHEDAVGRGDRILVVDDLLATGGTASAACRLVESRGGVVAGCAFLVELAFLHGRDRLKGREIQALIRF
ncbi:MAG: adenine phosphoribosyltransferase [Planctomycetes bacterium]|nr:adenine phosphoribosyltransferase [Planctomycetota bacterium]